MPPHTTGAQPRRLSLSEPFKSIVVDEEPYLLALLRYIHLNPVRTHIVADLNALDRYKWTGHAPLLLPLLPDLLRTLSHARRAG